jgi:PPOX class probable F420-dependent enzyme
VIDPSTDEGRKAAGRLEDELVIWLTTVRSDGLPQSSPVWFVWDGSEFHIYSQPGKPKVRNIEADPWVSLHLNSDRWGEDIVVFEGEARIEPNAPPVKDLPAYVGKYRKGMADIGLDPDSMAREFSVPIRVRPTRARLS